eukprot:1202491-Rhodomonas_salina.1
MRCAVVLREGRVRTGASIVLREGVALAMLPPALDDVRLPPAPPTGQLRYQSTVSLYHPIRLLRHVPYWTDILQG